MSERVGRGCGPPAKWAPTTEQYYQEQLQQQHQQKQQAFEALVGVSPILWRAWTTLAAASW